MMGDQTTRITTADELEKVLTSSDCLSVDPSGTLMVEGCSATDLLERYGSPLYVVSEFTLVTNDDPVRVRLIEEISAQLAKVGIRATPQAVPWETLRFDMLNVRLFDAVLLGFQFLPPDPDPYPYWHSSQANEFGVNFSNYNSPRADVLLEEARLTSDLSLRRDLYQEFQTLFAEQVPSLLLYQPVYSYAVSDSVRGVQIGPMINSSDRFQSVTSWYIATQRLMNGRQAKEETATQAP